MCWLLLKIPYRAVTFEYWVMKTVLMYIGFFFLHLIFVKFFQDHALAFCILNFASVVYMYASVRDAHICLSPRREPDEFIKRVEEEFLEAFAIP